MRLENTFTVQAPVERTWTVLTTPELAAPCLPGLTLAGAEGGSFTGTLKVKLGPVPLSYAGSGRYTTRDAGAHRFVLEVTGADERGHGSADATVTGTLAADGPDRTTVTLVSDLTIGGRPAQFGRGVVAEVVDRMVEQLAGCAGDAAEGVAVPGQVDGASRAAGNGVGPAAVATAVVTTGPRLPASAGSASAGVLGVSPTPGRAGSPPPAGPLGPLGSPVTPLTKLLVSVGGGALAALAVVAVLLGRRARR